MLPDFDVLSVMLVAVLGASLGEARSGIEVDLHSHANVVCEPTKCPAHCPKESAGYHYYYESTKTCLRCTCGRPNGPADCEEDIDPTFCDSVNIDISEECGKNSTVRQSCLFSCSVSGQLWWAAYKGKLEEVNTAIAAGANPTCQKAFYVKHIGSYDMTALHLAAWFNHLKMIATILDAAVDINLQTTDGRTPTYYASWNGSVDALQVLIEHNADVNLADAYSETPLIIATMMGHLRVVKALINANASLDVTGGGLNATALYWAALDHNPDIASLLIEHNADVNLADTDGFTPLMQAAQMGKLSVAKALINANASLDVTGGLLNTTALYYATGGDNQDIALLLIEHNANVNIADKEGFTPLMRAALEGQLSLAMALINANASLDVTGGWDNATALHYAVEYDKQDIALLLLQSGADAKITDRYGRTPAETAEHYENYELADLIENYSSTSTTEDSYTSS